MSIDAVIAAIEMNEKRLKVLVGQRDRVSDQIAIVESSLNIFRGQLPQAEIPVVGSNVSRETKKDSQVKYILVAVYDRRVDAFMTPVSVVSKPQAIRSFLKETEGQGEFAALKADVSLWCLGEVDEVTGEVDTSSKCELSGVELV